MSRKATPTSSDETTAGESPCTRELTPRRQTDTPGLMNLTEARDREELEIEPRLDEVELGLAWTSAKSMNMESRSC
jgi:hypothetical protein